MKTYILHLNLQDSEPAIWRQVKIPGRYRLPQVHRMMQDLFDWQDYHLHDFVFGSVVYSDPETDDFGEMNFEDENISLEKALGTLSGFLYRYDFGDSWKVLATVLEVLPTDIDSPECLAGERAGPPEDCGGVGGLADLLRVLQDPTDPEHPSMRVWVGEKYRPERFARESVNKRWKRQFGRKPKKEKTPKDAMLAGYFLAKLKILQMIVVALEEKPNQTLGETAQMLKAAGAALPQGEQTLKRAMAKSGAIRVRNNGQLELNLGPQLDEVKRWISHAHKDFWTNVPTPPPAKNSAVIVEEGPLTRAELDRISDLPWNISVRRLLTIATDVLGGRAQLEEAVALMKPRTRHFQRDVDFELSLRGGAHLTLDAGWLTLDRSHPQTEKARQELRSRLPSDEAVRTEQARRDRFEEMRENRKRERRRRHDDFEKAGKAVIAGVFGQSFALAVLDVRSGETQFYTEARREEAKDIVSTYDHLIGLDPKSSLEEFGLSVDASFHDITPPFKSMPVSRTSRKKVPLPQANKMSVGREVDPAKWLALAKAGKVAPLERQLRKDVTNLYLYWRFGIIHGALRRRDEWMPVSWNAGHEVRLERAVQWSIEDGTPLELTVKNGSRGVFHPQQLGRRAEVTFVEGTWLDSKTVEVLRSHEILDFRHHFELTDQRFEDSGWTLD